MSLRPLPCLVLVGLLTACAAGPAEVDETTGSTEQALKQNDPCAVVRCAAGTHCVRHGKQASCVADPIDPCAAVLCIVGTHCESQGGQARCVADPGECQTDSDCHKEDNYCGGCNCLALASGETAPTCSDPVQCFAAPCAVTSATPACVDGQCVMQ